LLKNRDDLSAKENDLASHWAEEQWLTSKKSFVALGPFLILFLFFSP
jgi:hypothetical protein